VKKQERLDYLEEGRKVREKIENERQKVKDIQAAKIDELKTIGINDKYICSFMFSSSCITVP